MTNTPDPSVTERAWQPHERNYSGGRFGVWHNDDFTMLRVEAGVADVTSSIRPHEAWDLALRLSPKLAERMEWLFAEMKKAQAALYQFTYAESMAPLLRKLADEWECDSGCERYGSSTCHERDEGCRYVEADELREFAKALGTRAAISSMPSLEEENARLREALVLIRDFEPSEEREVPPHSQIAVHAMRTARAALSPRKKDQQ